jgi:hypothetical protein
MQTLRLEIPPVNLFGNEPYGSKSLYVQAMSAGLDEADAAVTSQTQL